MDFQVSSPGGVLCTVHLGAKALLSELLEAIEASTGIEVACQQLFHGLRALTISDELGSLRQGAVEVQAPVELLLLRRRPWLYEIEATPAEQVWRWLENAPRELREDRDVILAAVTKAANALEAAPCRFRSDPDFVLAAMARNPSVLAHAEGERLNREFLCRAMGECGMGLCALSRELQGDGELVRLAVAQNGKALAFAAPDLAGDRELVLAALAQNGLALRFAAPELQSDVEVVLAAVSQNRRVLRYVPKELRAHPSVRAACREVSGTAPSAAGTGRALSS